MAPKVTQAKLDDEDLWGVNDDQKDYKKWRDMDNKERATYIAVVIAKIVVILGCLYLFVCSLSIMGSSFQILAGRTTGYIFGESSILANPIVGLIIGILVTVLVQSSSTSTSVVTTMVGASMEEQYEKLYYATDHKLITNDLENYGGLFRTNGEY